MVAAQRIYRGTLQWWMDRVQEGWQYGPPVLRRLREAYQVPGKTLQAALKDAQGFEVPGWYPSGLADWRYILTAAEAAGIGKARDLGLRLAMVQIYEGSAPYLASETTSRKWMGQALEDAELVVPGHYDLGVTLDCLEEGGPGKTVVSLACLPVPLRS